MSDFGFPFARQKELWRSAPFEERHRWIEHFYIEYPAVKKMFSDFIQKLEHCAATGSRDGMVIIGETGVGKTALVNRMNLYASQRYQRADPEKTICPVIQFAIPDPCNPLEVCIKILKALGENNPRIRRTKAETIEAASQLMNSCEVKCVLIDNCQDIPARRGSRGIEAVGTRIRTTMDETTALWVFLGTSDALKVIDSDPQLVKRASYRTTLKYFSITGSEEQRKFRKLLCEIDEWLPLAEPSCIVDPKRAASLFLATNGIFDRIIKLVDRAWITSFKAGRESLEVGDLRVAFDYIYGADASHINPFADDFVPRLLEKEGEPFEILGKVQKKC